MFSQSLITNYSDGHPAYLNWDDIEDRRKIQKGNFPKDVGLVVLNEIHEFGKWCRLVYFPIKVLKH